MNNRHYKSTINSSLMFFGVIKLGLTDDFHGMCDIIMVIILKKIQHIKFLMYIIQLS